MSMSKSLKCISLMAVTVSMLMSSGCGKYPVKKENILTSPIHIEMPATDGEEPLPKNEFIAAVMQGQDEYFVDSLGKQKATEFVDKQYQKSLDIRTTPAEDRISKAIENGLKGTNSFVGNPKRGFAKSASISRPRISWISDKGVASVDINAGWNAGNFRFTGLGKLNMDVSKHVSDKAINFDISSLSYVLECTYGGNTGCNFSDDFFMIEDALIESLKSSNSPPDKTPSIDSYRTQLRNYLTSRYSYESNKDADKNEKTFKIDFISAKSRLQRAMSNFKYDDKESNFTFSKEFTNPLNGRKIHHNYVIALFPDRNDTVVEFKGNYQSFTDLFGGKAMFGKETFDAEIAEYSKQVARILNK